MVGRLEVGLVIICNSISSVYMLYVMIEKEETCYGVDQTYRLELIAESSLSNSRRLVLEITPYFVYQLPHRASLLGHFRYSNMSKTEKKSGRIKWTILFFYRSRFFYPSYRKDSKSLKKFRFGTVIFSKPAL